MPVATSASAATARMPRIWWCRDAVVAKPAALTLAEAGALGVPFVTALEGFHRAGMPKPGDVVLVLAVNGMVGQAAAQIAEMLGARVFGVTRRAEAFAHAGVRCG